MKKILKARLFFSVSSALAIVIIMCGVILAHSDAKAISAADEQSYYTHNSVVRKAILNNIATCYNDAYMKPEVSTLGDFNYFSSLFLNTSSSGDTVALPTGLTDITDSNISCYGLFFGDRLGSGESGTFAGLFSLSGKNSFASTEATKTSLLNGMGYYRTDNDSDGNQRCIYFKYDETSYGISSIVDTDKICATLDSSDTITELIVYSGNGSYEKAVLPGTFFAVSEGKISVPRLSVSTNYHGYVTTSTPKTDKGVGDTWNAFSEDLRSTISSLSETTVSQNVHGTTMTYKYKISGGALQQDVNYFIDGHGSNITFRIKNNSWLMAATDAIKYLSNGEFSTIPYLSKTDQLELLSLELKHYFFSGNSTGTFWMCGANDWADHGGFYSGKEISLSPNGEMRSNCRINTSIAVNSNSINGFEEGKLSSSIKYNLEQTITKINELVEELKEADKQRCNAAATDTRQVAEWVLESDTSEEYRIQAQATIDSIDKIKRDYGEYWHEDGGAIVCYAFTNLDGNIVQTPTNSPGIVSPEGNDDPISSTDVSTLSACYSGAGVLGWIACPVLEVVGGATGWIYDNWISPALEIKAAEVMASDSATYDGWSAFRSIANIIFSILFVIVILSQLTGIGLDNYNIKKLLPRLVMVTILVNISFILCQLAVDLSNILGSSLRQIFEENLPVGTTSIFEGYNTGGTIAGGIFASVLTYLGLGIRTVKIAGFVAAAFGQSLLWILAPLILSLIACLISVLLFFIILGVRQAGIIILVVLSPVAIVCYALPNTKNIFEKWKKIFTALLIVYPICGILMGGGNYAGSLLLTIGVQASQSQESIGVFYILTAMLVTVVPFFFIPSILKNSMLAIGNLGMKISNLGNRVGSGLTSGVKRSQAYQEWQKDRQIALDNARVKGIDARTDPNSLGNRIRKKLGMKEKTTLSRRESLQRNRYMASSDKLMGERALAAANAKRKPMAYGDDRYNSIVERVRSRNTDEAAAAKEAAWTNDGTIDNFDQLETIAYDAITALNADFDNDDARAALTAAASIMERSEPGHQALIKALNHAEFDAARSGKREAALRSSRWLANAGLDRSGSRLKEESPTLNAMYKRYQNGDILDEADFKYGTRTDGTRTDFFNTKDIMSGLEKITPSLMPGMDENELKQAYNLISDPHSGLSAELRAKLAGAATQVFANDQISKNVKTKEGSIIQRIANHNIMTSGIASRAQVAKASTADFARIEAGLKNSMIQDADKTALLDQLERGIASAMGDDGFNGMTAEKAQIIDRILQEHRSDFISRNSIDLDKYNKFLGRDLYIDHGESFSDGTGI